MGFWQSLPGFGGRKKREKCPECLGTAQFEYTDQKTDNKKQVRDAIRACKRCKGTGYITAENQAWIRKGKMIAEYRIQQGMNQTEFAHQYGGLKTAKLVSLEKGYENPDQFISFLKERGINVDDVNSKRKH